MRKWPGLVLLAVFTLGACAAPLAPRASNSVASATGHTIFVTRHMHKAEGEDPSLSAEGAAAAQSLAAMLADEGIAAIFATPTRRAMETAAPLSALTGVPVTRYDAQDPGQLVASVAGARGPVLVVGHSNTVHDLVARFGGVPPAPLTEQDYGTVFVIDDRGGVRAVEIGGPAI